MTEIELKAHVADRDALIAVLNRNAVYKRHVLRDDEYYGKSQTDKHKIRIRKESDECGTEYLVTYKRKELKTDETGTTIEVNDEKECTVSSPEVLTAFLKDTGYDVQLKKHKDVMDWELVIPAGSLLELELKATFELCAVLTLGDFLEIEILTPDDEVQTVEKVHSKLEELLEMTGIPKSAIEKRYYSEMLRDI